MLTMESLIPKLRGATEDIGNGLSMLRVAVDAEVNAAGARGDARAAEALRDALVFVDEALESLVKAGRSLENSETARPPA